MKNIIKLLGIIATYIIAWMALEKSCKAIDESGLTHKKELAFGVGFMIGAGVAKAVKDIIRK
jgi:hypothetical protein